MKDFGWMFDGCLMDLDGFWIDSGWILMHFGWIFVGLCVDFDFGWIFDGFLMDLDGFGWIWMDFERFWMVLDGVYWGCQRISMKCISTSKQIMTISCFFAF